MFALLTLFYQANSGLLKILCSMSCPEPRITGLDQGLTGKNRVILEGSPWNRNRGGLTLIQLDVRVALRQERPHMPIVRTFPENFVALLTQRKLMVILDRLAEQPIRDGGFIDHF